MKTKPAAGTVRPVWETAAARAPIVADLAAVIFFVDMIRNSCNLAQYKIKKSNAKRRHLSS